MNQLTECIVAIFVSVMLFTAATAQSRPLARTPPMGWNSWNHFANKVDDASVRAQADAMVSTGMRDAGYIYINIDDSWEGKRDENGFIHGNEKFPDLKALADYIHSKGLKLGIYSSPGPKTCENYEGSYGHEDQDAQTYATWGVDLLKYDLCSFQDIMAQAGSQEKANQLMIEAYSRMRNALQKAGRPIVYSVCQYGYDSVWRWGDKIGADLWRTSGDIEDKYSRMAEIGFSQAGLSKYAVQGRWNDPDMLEVGNGGMTAEEYRTHMSLWVILAAPLIAGNDLTRMTPETLALLTNREVIAVDQDPAGVQGDRVRAEGQFEIWAKPLADGSKAVALFNRQDSWMKTAIMELHFDDLGYKGTVSVRDLWLHKDLGGFQDVYKVEVPAHGAVLLRISPR